MVTDDESHHDEKRTRKKRQKKSMVKSRFLSKRLQGNMIIIRKWIDDKLLFYLILGGIIVIFSIYLFRWNAPSGITTQKPPSEQAP